MAHTAVNDLIHTRRYAIQAATVIHATETAIGSNIDVTDLKTLGIGLNYVNGDETKVTIKLYGLMVTGGAEYPLGGWSNGSTATFTIDGYDMDATAKRMISIDVKDLAFVKVTEDATGGTPTGTLAAEYLIKDK